MEQVPSYFAKKAGEEPEEVTPPQEKKEIIGLHERLATIIRTVCGRPNLTVTTEMDPLMRMRLLSEGHNPDQEWFNDIRYDPKTREEISRIICLPPRIIESGEVVAKGKAAHEAGHVLITRFGEFVPDTVFEELGFNALINAIEERPTDQVVRDRLPGAGAWIDSARHDSQLDAELAAAQGRLGYLPEFAQLCGHITYEPHGSASSLARPNANVLAVYETIRKDLETLEHTVPAEGASEAKVVKSAKERYRILYKKIWPKVQELLKKDKEQEAMRQMLKRMQKQTQQESGSNPLDQLPLELRKELEEALKKAKQKQKSAKAGKKGQASGAEGAGKEEGASAEGEAGEQEGAVEDAGKDGKERKASSKESDSGGEEDSEEQEGKGSDARDEEGSKEGGETEDGEAEVGKGEVPISIDDLSKELVDELAKQMRELSQEERKELEERAKKELEDLEDAIVKELAGKLSEAPLTHKELGRREQEKITAEERRRLVEEGQKTLQEVEQRILTRASEASIYERTYQQIRPQEEELYERLEEIFLPNVKRRPHLRTSGSILNLNAVFRREAGLAAGSQRVEEKIFENRNNPEKKDYAFALLVDISGSMRGSKIQEAFKAAVLLAEVLTRLGIKVAVYGFGKQVYLIKDIEAPLDDAMRGKIADLSIARDLGTATGPALLAASRALTSIYAKDKFLFVLTDGVPDSAGELHAAVQTALATLDQRVIGLGLGEGTKAVQEYFPASITNIKAAQIPELLGALLEDVIRSPGKYRQQLS